MTAPADRIFTNAEVHTLADPAIATGGELDGRAEERAEAVAVRDGEIVRVGRAYEVGFLEGVDTDVVDCEGRVLLPGFIDAHTHMVTLGQRLRNADLGGVDSVDDAVARLDAAADESGWILGFGYDESDWGGDYLVRADLDRVSEERPVAAFREDLHTVSVNTVALDSLDLPEEGVRREGGDPTGVLVEAAAEVVREATEPDRARTRDLLTAAIEYAHERGVTGVHDMTRARHAPRAYRDLARAGDLDMRVRVNYLSKHRESLEAAGLSTNDGDAFVRVGALKAYADGSFGARTAKLREPYADAEGTGEWLADPDWLAEFATGAATAGYQVATHAIGDAAIEATLDAYADLPAHRHRVEHAELVDDDLVERMAETGVVASMQPNFLKWAGEDGLYERRLGDRASLADRLGDLHEAGVPLAFGSDVMPLDPLAGVDWAVNAPEPGQRLTVTAALAAYTYGSAYAGFDEERLGSIEVGKRADLVLLDESPWAADSIRDIGVVLTAVDGDVVYDGR